MRIYKSCIETIMQLNLEFLLLTFIYSQITLAQKDLCPPQSKINCLNTLFLFPCQTDEQCSTKASMVCCPTNCPNYSNKMCVSRVTDYCPFQPAFHQRKSCEHTKNCGKDMMCCRDVLGNGYCHHE